MRRAATLLVVLGAATALAVGGRTAWADEPEVAGEKSGAARIVEATPSERRSRIEQIPLPGLDVALGMSVDEVARAYVRRRFEHLPEERWLRNGTTFRRPEAIRPMELLNESLNERLVQAEFLFEGHLLYEVRLTVADAEKAAGPPKPLTETQGLRETVRGIYAGGDGKFVAYAGRSDAEKTTWVIRRGPDAAAPPDPAETGAAERGWDRRTLREEIERRRARWAATLGPAGPYTYLIQYRCECALIEAGPVLVRVENGRAVSVRSALSGEELPERRQDDFLQTIDDLFGDLARHVAAGADEVAVVWHPQFGYPIHASIDLDTEAEDDEVEFELVILNGNPKFPAKAGDGAAVDGDERPRRVETAEAARAAFRSQIGPALEKSFSGETLRRWREWIGADDGKKWDIRRRQFSEAFKRIDGTLTAREKASGNYYLLGKPADLRREGQCWEVGHLGDGLVGITGYIEAETGELVFVWLLPEG